MRVLYAYRLYACFVPIWIYVCFVPIYMVFSKSEYICASKIRIFPLDETDCSGKFLRYFAQLYTRPKDTYICV